MRNILALSSIIYMSCISNHEYVSDLLLFGQWESSGENYIMELIFTDDNKFELKFKNIDENFFIYYKGDYKVNNSIIPNTIDLKKIDNHSGPLYSIIKKIDENTFQIAALSNKLKLRPIAFKKNNSILFHRKIKREI